MANRGHSGVLSDRSVAFWTVAGGAATVLALVITLITFGHSSSTTPGEGGPSMPGSGASPATSSTPARSLSAVGPPGSAPIFLADLGPVGASVFNAGVLPADGQEYAHSFYLDPDCGHGGITQEPPIQELEFDLRRAYVALTGSVAESDDTRTVSRYQVDLFGDGRILFSKRLSYGQTLDLKVNVKSVLNLRVRATLLTGSDEQCFFQGKVVFGDLEVQ